MQDIDLAIKLQDSLTRRFSRWWSLDFCLELVREVWSMDEQKKELREIASELSDALCELEDLTTEDFSFGRDKPLRETVANAVERLNSY